MIGHELNETTVEILAEFLPGEPSLDARVRYLLEAELLRKLGQYRRADASLTQKYGMSFDDFLEQDVVHDRGYAWDVERDAMNWESAIGGIEMIEARLRELRADVETDA